MTKKKKKLKETHREQGTKGGGQQAAECLYSKYSSNSSDLVSPSGHTGRGSVQDEREGGAGKKVYVIILCSTDLEGPIRKVAVSATHCW